MNELKLIEIVLGIEGMGLIGIIGALLTVFRPAIAAGFNATLESGLVKNFSQRAVARIEAVEAYIKAHAGEEYDESKLKEGLTKTIQAIEGISFERAENAVMRVFSRFDWDVFEDKLDAGGVGVASGFAAKLLEKLEEVMGEA